MAASTPNPNRFSFRNPFNFFISSTDNNNNNSRPNSRPGSPTSPGFWSSLYRKTSSTSTNSTSNMSDASSSTSSPPPLSVSSSPATSVDSYFPSIVAPDNQTTLKPTPCTCGSSSLSSSTSSLVAPKRNITAPVIHVQPPVPGRKQIRVDPLSTQFPAPVTEASLEEMLARKPGRWSLTHYVRNAKVAEEKKVVVVVQDDAEKKRREMEEVKRELRRLASGL